MWHKLVVSVEVSSKMSHKFLALFRKIRQICLILLDQKVTAEEEKNRKGEEGIGRVRERRN